MRCRAVRCHRRKRVDRHLFHRGRELEMFYLKHMISLVSIAGPVGFLATSDGWGEGLQQMVKAR